MRIHDITVLFSAFLLFAITLAGEKERNRKAKFNDYEYKDCNPEKMDCEAAYKCGDGQYANEQGVCIDCQKNCEKCTCVDCCFQCAPGFFLISDQVYNGRCVVQLPKGYLPDLTSFEYINAEIIKPSELQKKLSTQYAIAYENKRIVTASRELPYSQEENGAPVFNGKKVRVKAYPCLRQCKQCPDGYLKNAQNNMCFEGFECPWPLTEAKQDDGEPICVDHTPDVFKAIIHEKSKKPLTELEKRMKQQKDEKKKRRRGPGQKMKDKKKKDKIGQRSLKCMTNKDGSQGIQLQYDWQIFKINDDGSLVHYMSETLFQRQSRSTRKLKIRRGDLQVGKYKVKCEVTDGLTTVQPEMFIEIDEISGTPSTD